MSSKRRSVLRSIGASSVAYGGLAAISKKVQANVPEDMKIKKVAEPKSYYLRHMARHSDTYQSIIGEIDGVEDAHSAEVYERQANGKLSYIVSFSISDQKNVGTKSYEDIAIAIDAQYTITNGKAVRVSSQQTPEGGNDITVYSADTRGDSVSTYSQHDLEQQNGDLRITGSRCGPCKEIYGVVCGQAGCNIGFATICYLVGGGLWGAWCGALAGDLCSFVDENSCEVGLNEAVCQILGYCSTSPGEEPCEEFSGGVESPHCDA